jgi:16S rRNA processing protein RimM
MSEDLIIIGKAIGTHGLGGALRIFALTDDPARFSGLKRVILVTKDGQERSCTLTSVRIEKSGAVIACREISSIDDAQAFLQGWVKIPVSEAIPLPEDRFFQFDLIGMSVYLSDGGFVGKLEDILETGSNDVFVVRNGDTEHLIPALKSIICEVDVVHKKMTVSKWEGLTENDAL